MKARNRELLALVPASLLVTAGFAAIFIQESATLSEVSLTYGGVFLGLCVVAHLVIRFTLPDADPYLFPLVAVLACFGLVVLYGLREEWARGQAVWFVIGLALFLITIIGLRRDFRVLERYKYVIAAASLVLLVLPRFPGIGRQVNGAYLGIGIGPVQFQPVEFAKLGIVVFLAAYLRENRDAMMLGSRRFLGLTFPPLKQFGPLLLVWGMAMASLFIISDLGSSLMFFGVFLALLYVATNRLSFVLVGLVAFGLGGWAMVHVLGGHLQDRVDIWLDPFAPDRIQNAGYQIAQGLFAQADGGVFGTGLDQALLSVPCGANPRGCFILPAPHTDLIYAVIVNELGLAGAIGLIIVYLLLVARGLKTAMIARDSFSTLLAAGLSFVLALQVFVIVGGVTRVVPLTGVTLPFVSYGGSSIMANFILLALLLLVSDRARREAGTR